MGFLWLSATRFTTIFHKTSVINPVINQITSKEEFAPSFEAFPVSNIPLHLLFVNQQRTRLQTSSMKHQLQNNLTGIKRIT